MLHVNVEKLEIIRPSLAFPEMEFPSSYYLFSFVARCIEFRD